MRSLLIKQTVLTAVPHVLEQAIQTSRISLLSKAPLEVLYWIWPGMKICGRKLARHHIVSDLKGDAFDAPNYAFRVQHYVT